MDHKSVQTSHIIAKHGLLHTSMQPLGTVSVRGLSLCVRREQGMRCSVRSDALGEILADLCGDQQGIDTWCRSHQRESVPS